MIKNALFKSFLMNTVFKVISLINKVIPKNEGIILLYSDMGFRDNIKSIYDYMIENGYNEKYKIIRSQKENIVEALPDNVKVVHNIKGIIYYLKCGHIFYAFGKLPIYPAKKQKVVQMWHGSPFKGADVRQKKENKINHKKSYYTNVLVTSQIFSKIYASLFSCKLEQISICGQPRTDMLFYPYNFKELKICCKKLVIWLPTFRKSEAVGYCDSKIENILPVVKEKELELLDEALCKMGVVLYIKMHPLQDLREWKERKFDFNSIYIRSHSQFVKENLDLYRLLGCADALITDYSSVFYDYMLINRPIGFTEDDIEEYKKCRGFSVDNPEYFRTGPRLNTYEDIVEFIKSVADDRDEWKSIREKVNFEVNYYQDFNNRRRALSIGGVYNECKTD